MVNRSHLELLLYAVDFENGVPIEELAEPEKFRTKHLIKKGYLIISDNFTKGKYCYKLTKTGQELISDINSYSKTKYEISAVAGIRLGMK